MKMKILNNGPALARYESPTSEILTISQINPILSGSVRLGELEEETASWDEV
ncbi:MAG: hypothetical protein MJY55_01900 [Bacteroidales bacterium]|nr:hypothetical protein [Bacteroidales bacterium]